MTVTAHELLRQLPSISALLEHEEVGGWLHALPRASVVASLQHALDRLRQAVLDGRRTTPPAVEEILAAAEAELARRSLPSLRPVVNATGVVLHTGLGRAPLCAAAVEALIEGASGYCNLEYDLERGARGQRSAHVRQLLCDITGSTSALVVNNNAAATFLILKTLAEGREVVVSRGQLVEIGGSYRLPDILAAAGATLREVGTTNRTRLRDYEKATMPGKTAMWMHVHTSNFQVVGFTAAVAVEELAAAARCCGVLVVDDLGSGALFDFAAYDLPPEPNAAASLAAGADLVCFSGDKLLGGPQCGVILGRADLIQSMEQHPLMRTYRVDKLTLLALEATLRHYLDSQDALSSIPALRMMRASPDELAARANALAEELQHALPGERFFVCSDASRVGGGSMPGQELPTVVVQWRPECGPVEVVAAALRRGETPVVARIRDGALCFDLRTIRASDVEALVAAVTDAVHDAGPDGACGESISLPVVRPTEGCAPDQGTIGRRTGHGRA